MRPGVPVSVDRGRTTLQPIPPRCRRKPVSEVGSLSWPSGPTPIDGLGTSFVSTMIPSNLGAVTAVSSMACCPRAMWARDPGLVGSTLVRNGCVCVCGSRGVNFAFSSRLLPSSASGCYHHLLGPAQWPALLRFNGNVPDGGGGCCVETHNCRPYCSCDSDRLRRGLHGIITFGITGTLPPEQRSTQTVPLSPCAVWTFQVKGTSPSLTCIGGGWPGRRLGQASEKGDMLPPLLTDHVSGHGTGLHRMHSQPMSAVGLRV